MMIVTSGLAEGKVEREEDGKTKNVGIQQFHTKCCGRTNCSYATADFRGPEEEQQDGAGVRTNHPDLPPMNVPARLGGETPMSQSSTAGFTSANIYVEPRGTRCYPYNFATTEYA
jgi:hypothetical protein